MKNSDSKGTLNFFSGLEFLGLMSFVAMLIYGILESKQIVNSDGYLLNSLYFMAGSLFVFLIGMLVSNPEQDQLDKDQLNEWSAERERVLAKHWKDKKEEEEKERELRLARIQTAT